MSNKICPKTMSDCGITDCSQTYCALSYIPFSPKQGEEKEFDTKFKFGDIVENHWASENNPRRIGIVIRSGKYLECTDGKGDYWHIVKDRFGKTKIIGHYGTPTPHPDTVEQVTPPFPDKMIFKEMFDGLFNRDFMSEEEFKTICDTAEMYANGCLKWQQEQGGESVSDGEKDKEIERMKELTEKAIDEYREYIIKHGLLDRKSMQLWVNQFKTDNNL